MDSIKGLLGTMEDILEDERYSDNIKVELVLNAIRAIKDLKVLDGRNE